MMTLTHFELEVAKRLGKKSAVVCPQCGAPLIYRQNRQNNSFFLGCNRYPDCTFGMDIPEDIRAEILGQSKLPGF
jgi:ssDNA-binding Zn-finger/Zn-ribbon topoisomerase 1